MGHLITKIIGIGANWAGEIVRTSGCGYIRGGVRNKNNRVVRFLKYLIINDHCIRIPCTSLPRNLHRAMALEIVDNIPPLSKINITILLPFSQSKKKKCFLKVVQNCKYKTSEYATKGVTQLNNASLTLIVIAAGVVMLCPNKTALSPSLQASFRSTRLVPAGLKPPAHLSPGIL